MSDLLKLNGKTIVIIGVANRRSVAYAAATLVEAAGARIVSDSVQVQDRINARVALTLERVRVAGPWVDAPINSFDGVASAVEVHSESRLEPAGPVNICVPTGERTVPNIRRVVAQPEICPAFASHH